MELDEILNDRSSGSMGIARKIISYFNERYRARENATEKAEKILSVHGAMVPVWNALNIVFHSIDDCLDLGEYLGEDKASTPAVRLDRGEDTVISLSNSSYVARTLTSLWNENAIKRAIVLKSEPGGEGQVMSKGLEDKGLDVSLSPDREVEACVCKADLGIFGCDAVTGDHFINKAGTGLTVQLLIGSGKRALVITSDWKVLPTGIEEVYSTLLSSSGNDGQLCWPEGSGNKVSVINGIFEKVRIRCGIEVVKIKGKPLPKRVHPALIEIGAS